MVISLNQSELKRMITDLSSFPSLYPFEAAVLEWAVKEESPSSPSPDPLPPSINDLVKFTLPVEILFHSLVFLFSTFLIISFRFAKIQPSII